MAQTRTELLDRLHDAVSGMEDDRLTNLMAQLEGAPEYAVSVGMDVEGDGCLYVKRGEEYLESPELDVIADELAERLNAKDGISTQDGKK